MKGGLEEQDVEGRRTVHLMAAAKRPGTSIDKSGQFIFQRQERVSTPKKKKIRKAKIYT